MAIGNWLRQHRSGQVSPDQSIPTATDGKCVDSEVGVGVPRNIGTGRFFDFPFETQGFALRAQAEKESRPIDFVQAMVRKTVRVGGSFLMQFTVNSLLSPGSVY